MSDFLFLMIGVAALVLLVALLMSWRKARRRAMLTNPRKDSLYHYTRPNITDVPADFYTHPHHRGRHSKPDEA